MLLSLTLAIRRAKGFAGHCAWNSSRNSAQGIDAPSEALSLGSNFHAQQKLRLDRPFLFKGLRLVIRLRRDSNLPILSWRRVANLPKGTSLHIRTLGTSGFLTACFFAQTLRSIRPGFAVTLIIRLRAMKIHSVKCFGVAERARTQRAIRVRRVRGCHSESATGAASRPHREIHVPIRPIRARKPTSAACRTGTV
jgi:hypothetical protein